MYNKDSAGEEQQQHSVEGGIQTEAIRQQRTAMFDTTSSANSSSPPSTSPSPSLGGSAEAPSPRLCITVAPFTGGPFEVKVGGSDSIEDLKKVIARRLKVAKERIYLLYRESELVDGSIGTNLLVDGSTVTLLPRAETGLISPKPEQSVMQALESLNEQQVNDFLSGAAPLNLTMRLGDHMMLIQLQLSTISQISSRRKSTIQISSSSPPYPTPPPSAPSSPTSSSSSSSFSSSSSSSSSTSSSSSSASYCSPSPPPAHPTQPRKVRVPLLSPGGLYSTTSPLLSSAPSTQDSEEPPAKRPKLDPKALAEASKNLTQTLKQLSSEVLTTKPEQGTQKPKKEERQRKRRATEKGAIIESMHHHGKGVYSGTFSGTLNPALQDANGLPKRDITTIVHILNDLLCAQFKAYSSSSSSRSSKHHRESTRVSQGASDKPSAAFERPDATTQQATEDQLEVTRHKVEALRKVMEEKKARRTERRQAAARAASYSTAWSVTKDCDKENGKEQEQDFHRPVEPEPCTA